MRYFIGVIFPALLQTLFVFIVIEMNTGNGSWVGLGAFLLGMFAIPATAIVNFIYLRAKHQSSDFVVLARCYLLALIVPFIVMFLLLVG